MRTSTNVLSTLAQISPVRMAPPVSTLSEATGDILQFYKTCLLFNKLTKDVSIIVFDFAYNLVGCIQLSVYRQLVRPAVY